MSSTVFGSRNPFYGMRRYPDNGVIAGVCEGLAAHFDWSPRVVRVIAVVLLIFTNWPIVIAYLLAWYIVKPVPGAPPEHDVAPAAAAATAAGPVPVTVPMPELKARFARLDARLRDIEECVTDKEFELRRELKKLEA